MSRPTTRDELLAAMDDRFDNLLELVAAFPAAEQESPGVCELWSLKDVLAHLRSWHLMFLGWEEEGRRGAKPEMPAPGFTWKMTPELNRALYEECKDEPWDEVLCGLQISHREVRDVVSGYGDDLFEKRKYPWTGSTSVGSYAVSATSSHYDWAAKLIRSFLKTLQVA